MRNEPKLLVAMGAVLTINQVIKAHCVHSDQLTNVFVGMYVAVHASISTEIARHIKPGYFQSGAGFFVRC